MLGIGLKLLGVGKFIKEFFLQNWKWIVPIILAAAAFMWTRDHYYNAGKLNERTKWEEKLDKERAKNQSLTNALLETTSTLGKIATERNNERVQAETIRENTIRTIVENNTVYEECKVDQEVIDAQNELKAMGPDK